MSRQDSDSDFYEWLNGPDADPTNAVCADCGATYAKADDDPTGWCDACSDARDTHTDTLLLRMAKAGRPADAHKEIA